MNRAILLCLFLFSFSLEASLGRKVRPQTLPESLCRLTLLNENTNDQFHCTGSHIGNKLIKTAGHCFKNSKLIQVQCLGAKNIEVDQVHVFEHYNHRELVMDEFNRWQDHALITTKGPINSKPFTVVTEKEVSQSILQNSERCLIAGFGLQEQTSAGTGKLSGTLYLPTKVAKEGRIFFSKGRYKYELLPGDSGGPLLCYYQNNWYDLGTASAHDWDHNSIYAPNEEVSKWMELFPLNKLRINNAPLPTYPERAAPQIKIGATYFLRPYSTFTEISSKQNYFNGDGLYTKITVTEINNGLVEGTVQSQGASKFFLCESGYLCFNDKIEAMVKKESISGAKTSPLLTPHDPFQ